MPQLKFNHRKRSGDGAVATARKALWRRVAAVFGAVMLAMTCLTTAVVYADGASFTDIASDPVGTVARAYQNALGLGRAAGDESPVADDLTLDD